MGHTMENEQLRVEVSSLGAELQSIQTGDGHEYLWQGDERYWKGRAPNLFPYVGRLLGGQYQYAGQLYSLGTHGFARHRDFVLAQSGSSALDFVLEADEESRAQYPFDFAFHVKYALKGASLQMTYVVENRGAETMYFGLGAHPGFLLPMEEGLAFEDYRLAFDAACAPERIGFGEGVLRNEQNSPFPLEQDRYLPLSHGLFDQDAIFLQNAARGLRLESVKGLRGIHIDWPDMPYLGIWQPPHTPAPFVCIEPWASLPGRLGRTEDLAEQPDLLSLDPDQVYSSTISIDVL